MFAIAVASCAAPFAAARPQSAGTSVVGQWKGETYASGSVAGVTLNLYANGTYARRVTVVTEYGWTVDGENLLLAPAIALTDTGVTYGKASAVRLEMTGDSLIARAGRDWIRLHRVTSAVPESPLLGRWEGLSDLNESVTQDFTADGRLIVSVTVSREAGRYTVSGESIIWAEQIPVPERRTSRYRFTDGKLTIFINPKLPPLELTRSEDSTS